MLAPGDPCPHASGSTIGKVERDGTVRGSSGSPIGTIESDGTIRDSSRNTIGSIESDGTIRDSSRNTIGMVDGYSSRLRHMVAAVLFFGGAVSVLKR